MYDKGDEQMYTPFYWNAWKLKDLKVIMETLRENNKNPNTRLKVRLSSTVLIKEINKLVKNHDSTKFSCIVNNLVFNYKIVNKKIYVKPSCERTWEIAHYNQYTYDNLTKFLNLLKEVLYNDKQRNINTNKTII
jgi:hypothetical protein